MAYLIDQPGGMSEEERQRLMSQQSAPSAAPAVPGASVGTPTAPAPAASGNFRDLSRYFSANRDAAPTIGTGAAENLSNEGWSALRGDDMGAGLDVQHRIDTASGSIPGMTSELQRQDSGYNAGMGKLDGYLLSQAGTNPFASLKETLSPRLGKIEARQEAPTAPENLYDTAEFKAQLQKVTSTRDPRHSGAADRDWQAYLNNAVGDYNTRGQQYETQRKAYEDYRRRRAENLGETYSELTQAFTPASVYYRG
jgi:hypothetical protein